MTFFYTVLTPEELQSITGPRVTWTLTDPADKYAEPLPPDGEVPPNVTQPTIEDLEAGDEPAETEETTDA